MKERLRFSQLKYMAKSPAHFRAALEAPRTDSPAMRLGRCIHSMVLGGPQIAMYDGIRRGKVWDEFQAENVGVEIVNASEYETIKGAAFKVLNDPLAVRLLEGDREQRIEWTEDGVDMAGTPDVRLPGERVTDLKTTADAQPASFMRAAIKWHYHSQLALYQSGLSHNGIDCPEAYIVTVETAPPYPVVCYRISDDALAHGELTWRTWLATYKNCMATGEWPGYATELQTIELPSWLGQDVELIY